MTDRTWEAGTGAAALDDVIEEHVNEAIKYAFSKDADTYAYFPMVWYPNNGTDERGAPPDDPLTVRFYSEGWQERVQYDVSIAEELEGDMESCAEDGSFADGLERVGLAMADLSTRILEAVRVGREKEAKSGQIIA